MRILFVGDVVGKIGRKTLAHFLPQLISEHQPDVVIVNGENATHGRGLSKKHYNELISLGVDVITLGNHFDDRPEIRRYIETAPTLVRPLNLIENYPGEGSVVYTTKNNIKIRVTNILGQAFMKPINTSPFASIKKLLSEVEPMIHLIDYHAEATAEKQAIGWEFAGQVSAIVGTHTHVQTRDFRILPGGTAYISDVGMTGAHNGVIGVEKSSVIKRMWYDNKTPYVYNHQDEGQLNAVLIDVCEETFKATAISPIFLIME